EIEQRANEDAARARADADAEAGERLSQIEHAATELIGRARVLQQEADQVLEELTRAAAGVAESLRTGAAGLRAELDSMRRSLVGVHEARTTAAAPAPEPEGEPEPEPAPEPAPEGARPGEEIRAEPVDGPGAEGA